MARFEIVDIEWGNNLKCLQNKTYYKTSSELRWGLKIGSEFSNVTANCKKQIHMGIILLERKDTSLVAPITSKYKGKDLISYSDIELQEIMKKDFIFLLKSSYHDIEKLSIIRLDKITEIDNSRIIKHRLFLNDRFRKALVKKIHNLFKL